MEFTKINDILRRHANRGAYSSGFAFYKNNQVSNNYCKIENNIATFYGSVFDEHKNRTYTSMITISLAAGVILNISCDCQSVFNESDSSKVCAHIVAIVLKGVEIIRNKNKTELDENDIVINPLTEFKITQSRRGSLGVDFAIEGIDTEDYDKIFRSYKENKKFHLLDNGNYLNLRDNELEKIFKLIDILGVYDDLSKIRIPNEKSIFLEKFLDDKSFEFIDGKNYVENVIKKYDKMNKKIEVPKNLNATLRDYQIKGFEFFNTMSNYNFGMILADEMGLGKTIQTIAFLLSKKGKKSLIVTPTALIYNWKNEFEKFAPDIKVGVCHGDKSKRDKIIENIDNYDVILTSYGTYKNDVDKYKNLSFDYCVIDEAQNIKNPNSIITKAIKNIDAKTRFALTGTPIENNLLELWSIFDFIMPGYLYTKNQFEKIFIKDPKNLTDLKKMINPFILRRRKSDVLDELPDKIEQRFYVELEAEHKRVYDSFLSLVKNDILKKDTDNITLFSYLTKLRQLSIAPEVVVKNYKGKNSKLEMLLRIIKSSKNRKILVFSQFTTVLNVIKNSFDKEQIKYSYLDGKTDAKKRLELVNKFNDTDESKVFLISLKAGGTGLNLTSASMVIHFDPWFNPAVEDQATDRAHRIGQKDIVDVIKLISINTVEEKIIKLQDLKRDLIDDVINSNLKNIVDLNSLSKDEIINLFTDEN